MAENQKQQIDVKANLMDIKHKIVVLSGKGGVGKSTISANIALFLQKKGYKVGILDSDIHGPSIPKILAVEDEKPTMKNNKLTPVETKEGLKIMSMAFLLPGKDDPVIWRGPMKMGAIRQLLGEFNWGTLDYLVIDLPPGTGDEPLSIAQLISDIEGVIIVTTPQDVALVSVRKSINFVKKLNLKVLGIVENMSGFTCPHCGKQVDIFKTGGGEKAAKDFGINFLGKIPLDPEIVTVGDSQQEMNIKNKETIKSYQEVVNRIEKIIK